MISIVFQTIDIIICLRPFIIDHILWTCSSIKVNLQTCPDEVFVVLAYIYVIFKKLVNLRTFDFVKKNIIIFIFPGSMSEDQFKSYDSNGPYITLV
jgi:hypothetical protein